MKNTNQLKTRELEQIRVDTTNTEETEDKLIKEHLGQIKLEGMDAEEEEKLTRQLMKTLNSEKQEGERNIDFENRLLKELKHSLRLID
jgi:sulfite reductase beta subunit-like hemoprotein